MVTQALEVYDANLMTVVTSAGTSLPVGSAILNLSDIPRGTVFVFAGGTPETVTLEDVSRDTTVLEDDQTSKHTIIDGGTLIASGTGVAAESLITMQQYDASGTPIGDPFTLTVFSQNGIDQDVWAFQSDVPLEPGGYYRPTGGNLIGSATYAQTVCYAEGTRIDTPRGRRRIEELAVGDLVSTLDHGPARILWCHSEDRALAHPAEDSTPVLIAAGALGPDRPAQDLTVSPQHRLLVGGRRQLAGLPIREALAPAKALTGLPGIRPMCGKRRIRWHHFACARHGIVTANGCLSESVLLGPMVLATLAPQERRAVVQAFAGAVGPVLNGPPARDCLTVRRTRCLVSEWTAGRKARGATLADWDRDLLREPRVAETTRRRG
ncbi:Hint domain-containing protein [Marinovum sp. SP66]|uniref:Hint domain-containing protein n=1 Tax=Marinovum TaxID=367771 RepID=UPI00237B5E09|nr:Hint domain-containing protein [Marinovum sp. SP66]MDD9741546.1 Hint domain-containing protein [Marinovum sp. SP66]